MKNSRSLEVGTGLFVLLGFAALAFLTTQLPGSKLSVFDESGGYAVTAHFDNVGDIQAGAPVSMGGVKIGKVSAVSYDSTQYKAVVSLYIDSRYNKIPEDSWAGIETAGLLGAKYVGIDPGGSETYLVAGSQIENTQSAMVLEKLINRLFSAIAGKGTDSEGSQEK